MELINTLFLQILIHLDVSGKLSSYVWSSTAKEGIKKSFSQHFEESSCCLVNRVRHTCPARTTQDKKMRENALVDTKILPCHYSPPTKRVPCLMSITLVIVITIRFSAYCRKLDFDRLYDWLPVSQISILLNTSWNFNEGILIYGGYMTSHGSLSRNRLQTTPPEKKTIPDRKSMTSLTYFFYT